MQIFILVITVFSGLMAGMLGVGGGLIIIPALFFVFGKYGIVHHDLLMHFCVGTSLAIIAITSIS